MSIIYAEPKLLKIVDSPRMPLNASDVPPFACIAALYRLFDCGRYLRSDEGMSPRPDSLWYRVWRNFQEHVTVNKQYIACQLDFT